MVVAMDTDTDIPLDTQSVEQEVHRLAEAGDVRGVVNLLEEHELASQTIASTSPPSAPLRCIHLLSYLSLNQLSAARFLWRRLGEGEREDAGLSAAWRVGQALWQNSYAQAHAALASHSWPDSFAPHIALLQKTLRNDAVRLLARAYSSIRPADVATQLGMSEAAAISFVQDLGWQTKPGFLQPAVSVQAGIEGEGVTVDVQHLADMALFLERNLSSA